MATPGWPKAKGNMVRGANVADAAALTSIDIDDDVAATADAEGDIATEALTSIDLVPALGTPDATGDLTALTGADAAQDNNNATIATQFNALRADVAALKAAYDINFSTLAEQYNALRADLADARTQLNAFLAAEKAGGQMIPD